MIDIAELEEARQRSRAAASKPLPIDWPAEKPLPSGPFRPIDPSKPAPVTTPPAKPEPVSPPVPRSALAEAIARRAVLRGAVKRLATRASGVEPVLAAIEAGDEDGILSGIVGLAVDEWLMANCGRPDTELTEWSARIEYRLRDLIYSAPHEVPDDADAHVRGLAALASAPATGMYDMSGRPLPSRPGSISINRIMIGRP